MEPISGRYLFSGASGMLGTALRRALVARGNRPLQLVRGAVAAENQIAWNPASIPPVQNTGQLEGCAAAIHLSGANVAGRRWTHSYKQELLASRVDSTRALANLLAALRQPPKVMLVASAIGFYGNRGDDLLDETSAPGTSFFADVCQQWEAAARPAVEAGIRVVHLRFGVVLAPGEGALAKMLPPFRLGLGGKLGSGLQWMSWIGLADTVAAVLFLLDTPSLAGPVNLTAPGPVTNAQFTQALARQLKRPAIFPVPAFALRLAFGQMADEALLYSARVLPGKLLDAGFRFSLPAVDEALAAAL